MNAITRLQSDARTTGVDYFDPEEGILSILRRATANQQDLHLEVAGLGEMLMLSSRGEYFSYLGDMAAFITAPLARLKITILAPGDARTPATEQIGRNIDELMWQAAFYASAGRLMQGCYRDDVVELAYWPNLSRLPHTPNSMRIAALLTRHPTSISFATRLLKVEPAEMYQFYSAARAAGLARPINRAVEEPKLEPHRNQSLLSSLLKKIAGL
jgi:hypothetical protein